MRDQISQTARPCSSLFAICASLSFLAAGLAGCGGGGGGDSSPNPPPANVAPTANAGADQNVTTGTTVTLNGSGTDANGDTLTYGWTQTAGPTITINNASSAVANFVAPASPATLEFQLRVSDGTLSATDLVSISVAAPQATVSVGGKVNYEFVPPNVDCRGLNFALPPIVKPIRGATVQLLAGNSDTVLASTVSNAAGDYGFASVPGGTNVRLRILAELKQIGVPGWDVEVRDNFDDRLTPAPLPARPLYAVDGAPFNTGGGNVTDKNLTATTGWGTNSYTGDRAAAPFAILDTIYAGMQLVLGTDANSVFPPLDAYWSVNNTSIDGDVAAGEIGTSFYTGNPDGGPANPSLFLLGDAADDTEEFDDHVVLHEWGHYFEDNFSRSDSIGGPHALGESLDPRVAFGEGFATALAAIGLDEPQYCDTGAPGTTAGFGINAETADSGKDPGWFNEISVITLLYDLYDTNIDTDGSGTDAGSIGFEPIFATMLGAQKNTAAFTTIFSFASALRSSLPDMADVLFLDSQLEREKISSAALDEWGTNEGNQPNGARDVLPVYKMLQANGGDTICTNSDFDRPDRTGNKLAERRYFQLAVPVTDTYDVVVRSETNPPITADPDDLDQSDPDIYIYANGVLVAVGDSGEENQEVFTTQSVLQAGQTYAVDLHEFRFADDETTPASYPEQICFNVSFTQSP
ncbi:MAG TPA: PKD domain-containing protein [Woeseiaceae bacterium]|nr:PKD domain-containing protein [Woeseiaceae bacterium]